VPKRPPHPCAVHGWVLVPVGAGCPECAGQPALERPRDTRPNAARRGYGRAHREMRDDLLRRRPWCADPFGLHRGRRVKATIRDHVMPLRLGGKDDKSNQQPLCNGCHAHKTAMDRGGRGG